MSKKLIALAVCLILTATIVGCTDSSSSASGNSTSSDVSDSSAASDNRIKDEMVGLWEVGYGLYSEDPTAVKYFYRNGSALHGYFEFYSNGTGVTAFYDRNGSVFEWEICHNDDTDSDELITYIAVKQSEDADEFGYHTIRDSNSLELTKAYIKPLDPDLDEQDSDPNNVTETVYFNYASSSTTKSFFIKIEDSDFTDNPDLDENALKSIATYKEKQGY